MIGNIRNLCSESVGSWNFQNLFEDSDTEDPSPITISYVRIRICFSNLTSWTLCEKTDEGEAESIFLILVLVFSSFLSVKYFLKIWGKTVIRLVFLSVSTIGTVKCCTKTWHFQILIYFSLRYYRLQSIFSAASFSTAVFNYPP